MEQKKSSRNLFLNAHRPTEKRNFSRWQLHKKYDVIVGVSLLVNESFGYTLVESFGLTELLRSLTLTTSDEAND